MVIFPWMATEFFTFLSSFMAVQDLATQSILSNIMTVVYMIPIGLSMGTAITLGNKLGANKVK
jgi:Na+-driven multidrug efflux pump